jgi:hypothetical protein
MKEMNDEYFEDLAMRKGLVAHAIKDASIESNANWMVISETPFSMIVEIRFKKIKIKD